MTETVKISNVPSEQKSAALSEAHGKAQGEAPRAALNAHNGWPEWGELWVGQGENGGCGVKETRAASRVCRGASRPSKSGAISEV